MDSFLSVTSSTKILQSMEIPQITISSKKGDFVYNPRKSNTAPFGPFNRYTLSERGIISPLYTCLVLQADINPSYLAWYFRSDAWHRYIYDNGSQRSSS